MMPVAVASVFMIPRRMPKTNISFNKLVLPKHSLTPSKIETESVSAAVSEGGVKGFSRKKINAKTVKTVPIIACQRSDR